jgi:hypothetical protein
VGGGLDLIEVVDGDLREHGDPVATRPVFRQYAMPSCTTVPWSVLGPSTTSTLAGPRRSQSATAETASAGQGGGLAPSSVTLTTVVAPNSSGPLPTTTVTSVTLPTGLPSTTLPDGPGGNGLGCQRGCRSGA